jgi:hypothetical protein
MKRLIRVCLAACLVAGLMGISGCAEIPKDAAGNLLPEPNYKAALEAWKEAERARQTPVVILDMAATPGKSIENLASLKVATPGSGSPLPMPQYKAPPGPWDWLKDIFVRGFEAAEKVVPVVAGINAGADVIKAGYNAAGNKTTVGGNYYSGAGAGDNRGNPTTNTTTTNSMATAGP